MGRILLAPLLKKGEGTGHLTRCLSIARNLDEKAVYLLGGERRTAELEKLFPSRVLEKLNGEHDWDFIVLDRRSTSLDELKSIGSGQLLIGLDEGGPAREYLPFLIDTLPIPARSTRANISSPTFLDLPRNRRDGLCVPAREILVSFGGEDPANLTSSFLHCVAKESLFKGCSITVVEGPVFEQDLSKVVESVSTQYRSFQQVHLWRSPENLKEKLYLFDLVITSYGLTCFESLAAGVPVILVNPTRYHRLLSRQAAIPEVGIGKPAVRRIRSLIKDKDRLQKPVSRMQTRLGRQKTSLSDWLRRLSPLAGKCCCPVCGNGGDRAVARFEDRSYFRCSTCGLVYLLSLSGKKTDYDSDYFESEYRKQYGRTYLEDFERIKTFARSRLREIKRVAGDVKGKRLLDVGCALGPFLVVCREQGILPHGVDVSPGAVDYVRNALKIPCVNCSFEDYKEASFHIVTMWYVIEHLENLMLVLKKINRILSKGGVFAFATPNLDGISGRTDLTRFLERSPADHVTVWSPRVAREVLAASDSVSNGAA